MYTTSNGKINICDLRESSDFHKRPSLTLETNSKSSRHGSDVFKKWLNCVSSASFVSDPNLLFSRDYLSVKMWDLRAAHASYNSSIGSGNRRPVFSAQVTDYMERNLGRLLENDSLDDRFFMDISPDSKYIATGGYDRSGHVMDINASSNQVIKTRFGADRGTPAGLLKIYDKQKKPIGNNQKSSDVVSIDLNKRVNLGCWSPNANNQGKHTLALVFRNCIYLYNGSSQKSGSLNKNRHNM